MIKLLVVTKSDIYEVTCNSLNEAMQYKKTIQNMKNTKNDENVFVYHLNFNYPQYPHNQSAYYLAKQNLHKIKIWQDVNSVNDVVMANANVNSVKRTENLLNYLQYIDNQYIDNLVCGLANSEDTEILSLA